MLYDPATIQRFYDSYGEREWRRFEARAQDRVNLHLHERYLRRFVEPGMHVLDAGAGPGRFTIELARLGARVTVLDISEEMLEQNRRRVEEAGCEAAVEARHQEDITDLGRFAGDSFDAVLCYGGPLSYVMERADHALAELLRVAKPGAPLLLSVMSTAGSTRTMAVKIIAPKRTYIPMPECGSLSSRCSSVVSFWFIARSFARYSFRATARGFGRWTPSWQWCDPCGEAVSCGAS